MKVEYKIVIEKNNDTKVIPNTKTEDVFSTLEEAKEYFFDCKNFFKSDSVELFLCMQDVEIKMLIDDEFTLEHRIILRDTTDKYIRVFDNLKELIEQIIVTNMHIENLKEMSKNYVIEYYETMFDKNSENLSVFDVESGSISVEKYENIKLQENLNSLQKIKNMCALSSDEIYSIEFIIGTDEYQQIDLVVQDYIYLHFGDERSVKKFDSLAKFMLYVLNNSIWDWDHLSFAFPVKEELNDVMKTKDSLFTKWIERL